MKGFKDISGNEIQDLQDYVTKWVKKNEDSEIFIGCDSQEYKERITYAVSVCLYRIGNGAHVIVKKEHEYKKEGYDSLKNILPKLWNEVVKSVEVAETLKDVGKKITIHLDYNSSKNDKSNQLYESGIGFVKSLGFLAEGKPDAWSATKVADKYCR